MQTNYIIKSGRKKLFSKHLNQEKETIELLCE